jgi:flagellar biosynthesis GTPase FlhF
MNFEGSVVISKKMSNLMMECSKELCERAVMSCASHYNFDGEEAKKLLGLCSLKVVEKLVEKRVEKRVVEKARFPLPFNGEMSDDKCHALRHNSGLYTQCQVMRKDGKMFCKQCEMLASKSGGVSEYGTIEERMAVDILEYVDPKGRKPVAYIKIMKKYKVSEEEVLEEALRLNVKIDSKHFKISDDNVKRGRPVSKDDKPVKEVGAKGRPKKTKKVIQIDGDDDDLFASLVADANKEEVSIEAENEALEAKKQALEADKEAKKQALEADKEAKKQALEAEKEAKKQALEAEKESKKQALEAEKEAKKQALEAKKQALEAEKEAKKQALEAEKEAKKQALEAEKEAKKQALEAEKEAKKQALEAEKEAKKQALEANKKDTNKKSKAATPVMEEDDEPDVVKKIDFEGKKYLKSKKTGIIYDYTEYIKNGDQNVIGKWDEVNNKINFKESDEEESEDEYET